MAECQTNLYVWATRNIKSKLKKLFTGTIEQMLEAEMDEHRGYERVWKNNCVNANNPEKRTKAKNAAKQGNAGERPDAAARYTVKSSGVNSLLFMNSAGGRCHDNARCESIRGLVTRMKNELFYSTDYTTEQLKTMIWSYYMSYWNNRRIRSSIGGVPPAEKRRRYYSDKTGKSAADTME